MVNNIHLSVVVPCKNEEQFISRCLNGLLGQRTRDKVLEIVVVDNGSTDRTFDILQGYRDRVKVYCLPRVSISELRNYGANESHGEWIAFIDADVAVRDNWYISIIRSLGRLQKEGYDIFNVVTGSTYSIPENPTWIERAWFNHLVARDRVNENYINGGNLIVHRTLFNKIGGFNPAYETGEDVKFCRDVKVHGGSVVKDPSISVIHHGYPKTITQFFRRERWHGLGMINCWSRPWESRDLSLSLYYVLLSVLFLLGLAFWRSIFMLLAALLLFIVPLFIFALKRFEGRVGNVLLLTLLYVVYGWAKVFSLLDMFSNRRARKAEI